jgi:peptide/nickel transport system ATP-binding protein
MKGASTASTLLRIDNYHLEAVGGLGMPSHELLNGINLSLKANQVLAIVGESGSGKSLTGLSLLGLLNKKQLRATAGNIWFQTSQGTEVDLLRSSERDFRKLRGKELAVVFQEPMMALNPLLKVGTQISDALSTHLKLNRVAAYKQALQWMERVHMPRATQMLDSYPHQLSGGQEQRVMLALAMCCHPRLLVADEPTTALDVTLQQQILHLMRELQQETAMGLIFISHDLGLVADIADEIAVFHRGSLLESGSVHEVLNSPKHPYTKGLLNCRPRLSPKFHRLPTVEDFMQEDIEGKLVATNVDIRSFKVVSDEAQAGISQALLDKPILAEVRDLRVRYALPKPNWWSKRPGFDALKGISLAIHEGEALAVVGESGSGKTTLGRAILRLVEAANGQILLEGKDITHLKGEALRKLRCTMQLVYQNPAAAMNPRQTVAELLMEPLLVHGIGTTKAEWTDLAQHLLEQVRLNPKLMHRYPSELSGGQKQRVCIARALGLKPKLLVLDESVAALDVSVQAQILNLLNDLRDEFGLTYLFITHDLQVVAQLCHRVAVLNQGEIVELGPVHSVLQIPQHPYTQRLLAAVPGREAFGMAKGV